MVASTGWEGRDVPGLADHGAGGVHWLADGAGAVGDGQRGGLYQTIISIDSTIKQVGNDQAWCALAELAVAQSRPSHRRLSRLGDPHLGDRVGLAVVAELGGFRAVGGVISDDLGGVAHSAGIAIGGCCGSRKGKDGGGELQLHVDGRFSLGGVLCTVCSRRAVGVGGRDEWMDGCRVMWRR